MPQCKGRNSVAQRDNQIDTRSPGAQPIMIEQLRDRFRLMQQLSAQTGRRWTSILSDLIRCRKDGFFPWEYLVYKFYEPGRMRSRKNFAGVRCAGRLESELNDQSRWNLVDDKLVCQERLARAGIPTPRTEAILTRQPRTGPSAPVLRESDEIVRFLQGASFPLFMKPIADGRGHGCCRVDSWDGTQLHTSAGSLTIPSLIQRSEKPALFGEPGIFLSRVVEPHPALRALHPALSTIRFGVLVTPSGPVVVRAALRIPVGCKAVDNFDPFSGSNNILAYVDADSGVVGRAVSGYGLTEKSHERHPDSEVVLEGLQLPCWQSALELVAAGSVCFPGLRFQHWDVAISDSGPIVIEVNVRGGLQLFQQPTLRPFLDRPVRDLLRRIPAAA